jgi:hypothetical protein
LKAFSASIEMTKWCAILKIFVCWTIPVSKDEANRSFWYVVGFGLPLYYCGFLHQCSLVLLFGCVLLHQPLSFILYF